MNRRRKMAFASMVLLGRLNLQLDLVTVSTGVQEYTGFERRFRFHRSSTFDHTTSLFAQILSEQSFLEMIVKLRRKRRFWAAHRGAGIWESQFLGIFHHMGQDFPDWEDAQYSQHFRLSKDAFWRLHRKYGHLLERQVTHFRAPVASDKHLAMTLHYLAQEITFARLR